MSIATDIQAKVQAVSDKVDALVAEVAALKASQPDPADAAALAAVSAQLDAINAK